MDTTRLSSKGQLVIPKAVRDAHGWKEGTEFTVEATRDAIVLRPKRLFPRTTVDQVFGSAGYKGPPKTIEDMNAGIDEALKERWERKSR